MDNLNASILRVLSRESALGVGCLVNEHLAVTCAHVLRTAGVDLQTSNVQFDFPLIAPGKWVAGHVFSLNDDTDIALLEIVQPLPEGAMPITTGTADDLWEHTFRAFGFPSGYDDGVWASGVLRGSNAKGWLHIEDTKEVGFRVQSGFSGGPVWDNQLQTVVGIVVAAGSDPSIKVAFCIPASMLAEAYPDLRIKKIVIGSLVPHMAPSLLKVPIGRDAIIERLVAELQMEPMNEELAVVALWGMAGVGKTTLAIAIANRPDVESVLPDGTLWVSLGPNPDEMSLLAEWARQLDQDVTDYPSAEAKSRAISTVLHDKKMLIVLDDVWDVDQARHFLIGGRGCRLLITTRNKEMARTLAFHRIYPVETLTELASLELLPKLAPRAVVYDKDGANQLVALLGGLPLALTIVGQLLEEEWDAGLGTSGLLIELQEKQERLELILELTAESLTLAAVFGISYKHLPNEEAQHAFRQLGVFGGKPNSFSIEAAAATWKMELREAQKTMVILVNRPLVEVIDIENGRYALHALLADYAASLLDQFEEEKLQAYWRHSAHFLNTARQYTSDNIENWHNLDVDWNNIRLDVEWLSAQMNQPDPNEIETQSMADFVSALEVLIQSRRPLESEKWLQAGKNAYQKLGRTVDEAWLLLTQGQLALDKGLLDQAVANFGQSAQLFESSKAEAKGLIYAQGNLGAVHMMRGEYSIAKTFFEKANELCEKTDNEYGLSVGYLNLGTISQELGQTRKCLAHLSNSIDLSRKTGGSKIVLVKALGLLGKTLAEIGDIDEALKNGHEAYEIVQQSDIKSLQGIINQRMGEIYAHKNSVEADHYFLKSIRLLIESNVQEELAEAHAAYGKFLAQNGKKNEAKAHLLKANQIFEQMGTNLRTKKVKKILRGIEKI